MARLTDFRLLSFDVYGTLLDWERGVLTALEPLFSKASPSSPAPAKKEILEAFEEFEKKLETDTPDMLYNQVLATIHWMLAQKFNLPTPSQAENEAFASSIATWPAFPDTVDALKRLQKTYKLVVLSNVDRNSFAATNAGALREIKFDGILTAQDIGSYKPDPRNFEYMLKFAKAEFGIEKDQVLQTAQSQFHDHRPAKAMGIHSVWIQRAGAAIGFSDEEIYDWKFPTLGAMADAVENEKSY